MHVKHWFGRLDSHCSQHRQFIEALASKTFSHPWCEPAIAAEISAAAATIHGGPWTFDPTKHESEALRKQIIDVNPALAEKMLQLCAQPQGSNELSWFQMAREIHRVYASTLDYSEGSLDSHMIEKSFDGRIRDGFTLRRLMRHTTVLHQNKRGVSTNCAEMLDRIKFEFSTGIKTFFTQYRAQITIFAETGAYPLPEAYHCDRILSHLRKMCKEFQDAASRCRQRVQDKSMQKTINAIEDVFLTTEFEHGIGESYHGTPLTTSQHGTVNLATPGANPGNNNGDDKNKNRHNDNRGKYPKGSCKIHKFSTNHLDRECTVRQKRNAFIHPVTGKVGLKDEDVCAKCPLGWHTADLHDDERFNPPRRRGYNSRKYGQRRLDRFQQQQDIAQANAVLHHQQLAAHAWYPEPPRSSLPQHPPLRPPASQPGAAMMVNSQTQAIKELHQINQQLLNHIQHNDHGKPPATAATAQPAPRKLVEIGRSLQHIKSALNTQRL